MMKTSSGDSVPPPAMVFWVAWFSALGGLVIIPYFIAGGIPTGRDTVPVDMFHRLFPVGLATGSLLVRFLIIPRLSGLQAKLPAMIVGLSLAEGAAILAAFIIDKQAGETRLTIFLFCLTCVLVSAPVYAPLRPREERTR